MIAVDTSQVVPAVASPPVAGSVKSTGAQLVAAFPPRPFASSWPATEARRSAGAERVLAAPFALDNPLSQRNRRLGVLAVLGWLREQPGECWQQRGALAAPRANRTGVCWSASTAPSRCRT